MFKQDKYLFRLTLLLSCFIICLILGLFLLSTEYELIAQDGNVHPAKKQDLSRLYWVIGLIGGLIILTLSYVSWRKYKAEKKRQKKDSNS